MREPAKSTLGNLLKSFSTKQPSVSKLTHRCWWWSSTPNSCFGTTVHMVIFVRQTYRVFWNIAAKNARWCYGNISSTTAAEQTRAQKCTLSDIIFYLNVPTASSQAAFLANENDKKGWFTSFEKWCLWPGFVWSRLSWLRCRLTDCVQSTSLITVRRPTSCWLVMVVAQANASSEVDIGETSKHLLFVHAVTRCDTASAIYRQGKR